MRQLPFFKRKKGWSVAGTGEPYGAIGGGGGGGSSVVIDETPIEGNYTHGISSAWAYQKGVNDNLQFEEITDTVNTCLIRVQTLPEPSEDYEGVRYMYDGVTTSDYVNGYIYECVSDGENPATYTWVQKDVQPATSPVIVDTQYIIDNNGVNVGGYNSYSTTINITKAGYIPISILGLNLSQDGIILQSYNVNSNILTLRFRNLNSSTSSIYNDDNIVIRYIKA